MPPVEPTDEERLEELPGDAGETPFSVAERMRDLDAGPDDDSQTGDRLDPTHPATDTNIELEEVYDEGIAGAAEASEPNAGDTVLGYKKPEAKDLEQRSE